MNGVIIGGRREQSKDEKRRRIRDAARETFHELGYERASIREIAKRARVATGTLFLYAADKRNLLLWILNDDLEAVTRESFEVLASRPRATLLDELVEVFEARYRYWGADPDLSVHALQEIIVLGDREAASSPHSAYYHRRRVLMTERVATLIRDHQTYGDVGVDMDADVGARLVMAIYNASIRAWLRIPNPLLADGMRELRLLLRLAIDGFRGSDLGR